MFSSRFYNFKLLVSKNRGLNIRHQQLLSASTETFDSEKLINQAAKLLVDFDSDSDGQLSVEEIIKSSIVKNCREAIQSLLPAAQRGSSRNYKLLFQYLSRLIPPRDLIMMAALVLFHKWFLKFLYNISNAVFGWNISRRPYETSLLGHLEQPITSFVWALPLLYGIDILSIFLQYAGLDAAIIGRFGQVLTTLSSWYLIGSLLTRFKDWIVCKRRLGTFTKKSSCSVSFEKGNDRDAVKDRITDEITSGCIWFFISFFCIESLSLPSNLLSSFLAVGGIGSASLIVALRPVGENLLGGLLLRLQDKFRLGDSIAVEQKALEGVVESISPLQTRLRKDDNSITTVPNKVFMELEVVNWSRAPYRLFFTTVEISRKQLQELPTVLRKIEEKLMNCSMVENIEREVLVAATGFREENIVISVEVNLKAVPSDKALFLAQNTVVQLIASCLPTEAC